MREIAVLLRASWEEYRDMRLVSRRDCRQERIRGEKRREAMKQGGSQRGGGEEEEGGGRSARGELRHYQP